MNLANPAINSGMTDGVQGTLALVVGGTALALGSLGVFATSVLYALSPPAAALPAYPLDQALVEAAAGATTLFAAGTVGIFSDIVMAVGTVLIAFELVLRRRVLAAAGWVAMLLSIAVFTLVDAIGGYVLAQLAIVPDSASAFAGFKRLFDVLFLLGTMVFGAGAIVALAAEMSGPAVFLGRPLAMGGILVGLAGVLTSAACFIGLPFGQGVGISVALSSALFTAIGVQLARNAP